MNNEKFPLSGKRIWVAGHNGMAGSAIVRRLQSENCEILTIPRSQLDLRNQAKVETWMHANRPDMIFLAAANVSGIQSNDLRSAEFLYDNLMIEANVIHSAYKTGVERLMFFGTTCIYPRDTPQPMKEEALLSGPLEPTSEWYAVAKIAGIKLCQAYRKQYGCSFVSVQPTNLYGPGDNYDLATNHVMAALIKKAHEAKVSKSKSMVVWGSGRPLREFCHVDDLADASVFLMKDFDEEQHINIGTGEEVSIRTLAEIICDVVGFEGELEFDETKPDGMPRKLTDCSRLKNLGWEPKISLRSGVERTYREWSS